MESFTVSVRVSVSCRVKITMLEGRLMFLLSRLEGRKASIWRLSVETKSKYNTCYESLESLVSQGLLEPDGVGWYRKPHKKRVEVTPEERLRRHFDTPNR